jgi:hypothetical protein
MRLNYGEGNGVRLAGRTSRNTARTACTSRKVDFAGLSCGRCSILLSPADGRLSTVLTITARGSTASKRAVLRGFFSPLTPAVGAVGIFRTSNDGHRLLPLLPQSTILHAQHQQCLTGCFGRLAPRSRLLTNHAPQAVASFHSLHRRGATVVAPFQCRRPPVYWAFQVPGEAESLTSLPSAGLPPALG